jgi:peptide/nickel transport system substrate-binding protein
MASSRKNRLWIVFVPLVLIVAFFALIVRAPTRAAPTTPDAPGAVDYAEIAWSRVHSGTLDGETYADLYWGGLLNSRLDLVDIDDDGDLDVYVGGEGANGGRLHLFRNDGTPSVPSWTHVVEDALSVDNCIVRPTFGDLNGDGTQDLIVSDCDGFRYYDNTGTAGAPSWSLQTTDLLGQGDQRVGSQALADIDGDNDLDLFYAHPYQQQDASALTFYENTGSAVQPSWMLISDTYAGITHTFSTHPTFFDIDGDNDLDLFLGYPGSIAFYRNDGTANSPSFTHITEEYGGIRFGFGAMHFQVVFGDLSGDALPDMLIGHEGGWIVRYDNTGTRESPIWTRVEDSLFPLDVGFGARPVFADIDADGDQDMFLGEGYGVNGAKVRFLRNDGTAIAPTWTTVSETYGRFGTNYKPEPAFVDLNGDGLLDCVVGRGMFFGGTQGKLAYYQNTGTSSVAAWTLISDTYAMVNTGSDAVPAFADIDGDGDEDMFVSTSNEEHFFYRNDGNATSPQWTYVTDHYADVSGRHLNFVDVDGDSDLDMFTASTFYRNDGDVTTPNWVPATPEGLNWSGGPVVGAELLNGDSLPDLVVGAEGGVWLYENLGDLPPKVSQLLPGDGGSTIEVGAIVVKFDNAMDPATMVASNVEVLGSPGGSITTSVSYNAETRQLYIFPNDTFATGASVQVTLKAAMADIGGNGLDGDGDGLAEGSPADDKVWTFDVATRDHLVIALDLEPASLYRYGNGTLLWETVFRSFNDVPFEIHGYTVEPTILTKLPSPGDGDAEIRTVTVDDGDWVVDATGDVVTLFPGESVLPAGCRSDDCAVTFDGTPLVMDQMEVTHELLDNLRWSDGEVLTADDSLYAFEVHSDPDTFSPVNPTDDQLARTASYEVVDSTHTRWTGLPGYVDSQYQRLFWMPFPRHAWGHLTPEALKTAPESSRTPISYGPYAVDAWEPGVAITLTANSYYYRAAEGLPAVDRVVIRFVGDWPSALAMVASGEADVAPGALSWGSTDLLEMLAGEGFVNAYQTTGQAWEHADFAIDPVEPYASTRPDFFENVEMRRAIAYCLNRPSIADSASGGTAPVLNTYVPPEHPLYPGEAGLMLYPYSPVSGTALLDGLGWVDQDGDGVRECRSCTTPGATEGDPLAFTWISTDNALRRTYMERAQDDLAACGIDLALDNRNDVWNDMFQQQYDVMSFAWITDLEPPCELYLSSDIPSEANGWSGLNITAFDNAAFDTACLNAQRSLPGTAEYVTYHQEAMRILSEQAPIVPLFQRPFNAATHPRVLGFRLGIRPGREMDLIETWDFAVDALAPEGSLKAGSGAQSQSTTPITLYPEALDQGGGTVEQMYLRERTWNGSDWEVVTDTGWIPYATSVGWDLDPTAAAHYLSAYFMDDSGNISALPAQTIVNLAPNSADIDEGGIDVYRVRVEAGETFTAALTTYSGDADLYVWAPENEGAPDAFSNQDGTLVDQVVITNSLAGDYHIEVHGYVTSAYKISLDAPVLTSAAVTLSGARVASALNVPASSEGVTAKTVPEEPLSVEVPDDQTTQAPGGYPDAVELRTPRLTLDVGGDTTQLTAEVWDKKGDHVPDGTVVTFTTTLGTFLTSGATRQIGVTSSGLVRATLVSGAGDGRAAVTAHAGAVSAQKQINVVWPEAIYLPLVIRQ